MRCWLIDSYRCKNKVVLWVKTIDKDLRIEMSFRHSIYVEKTIESKAFFERYRLRCLEAVKNTYEGNSKEVYEVPIFDLSYFERFVRWIEKKTRYRLILYDADIKPEQMFLYKHDLRPFSEVEIVGDNVFTVNADSNVRLDKMMIKVQHDGIVLSLDVDGCILKGEEKKILHEFNKIFRAKDPDVIIMDHAYSLLPFLNERLLFHGMTCPFHRWDSVDIRRKGGKTFFSYGNLIYRDFAIRLHGRFLVDMTSVVGSECGVDGIIELCQLSGNRFQQVASRSFGAVFQSCLVREMVKDDQLIPYKEKPIDIPLTFFEMLKSDRAGLTLDPKVGFHEDVAEIDFSSMFPWLIYNHNISAETIVPEKEGGDKIPILPLSVSLDRKGLIPRAIKPILDRRMYYKRNPTTLNKAKAKGLKWVLVTSYGYLRFREFKLGLASSHMAIGAYARDLLIKTKLFVEEKGFEVVHGIVDSLFIKKKGVKKDEVEELCKDIGLMTGIPMSFEGVFKWVVFLPSINDYNKPVCTHYYGVFRNNEIKARGIDLRKRSIPLFVKLFQQNVLQMVSRCSAKEQILDSVPDLCRMFRKYMKKIGDVNPDWLAVHTKISRIVYKSNIPQKRAVLLLKKKGKVVKPGQKVSYVFSDRGVVLPEDYMGNPDLAYYRNIMLRSLFDVLQPFGVKMDLLKVGIVQQKTLSDYVDLKIIAFEKMLVKD